MLNLHLALVLLSRSLKTLPGHPLPARSCLNRFSRGLCYPKYVSFWCSCNSFIGHSFCHSFICCLICFPILLPVFLPSCCYTHVFFASSLVMCCTLSFHHNVPLISRGVFPLLICPPCLIRAHYSPALPFPPTHTLRWFHFLQTLSINCVVRLSSFKLSVACSGFSLYKLCSKIIFFQAQCRLFWFLSL